MKKKKQRDRAILFHLFFDNNYWNRSDDNIKDTQYTRNRSRLGPSERKETDRD